MKRVARIAINLGTVLMAPRPLTLAPADLNVEIQGYMRDGENQKSLGDFRIDGERFLSEEEFAALAAILSQVVARAEALSL